MSLLLFLFFCFAFLIFKKLRSIFSKICLIFSIFEWNIRKICFMLQFYYLKKTGSTGWLIIIPTLLPITLSLRQKCQTSLLWNLSIWSQGKKSAIKSLHSANVNPRTFWVNSGLVITSCVNLGFVSQWKQKKSLKVLIFLKVYIF